MSAIDLVPGFVHREHEDRQVEKKNEDFVGSTCCIFVQSGLHHNEYLIAPLESFISVLSELLDAGHTCLPLDSGKDRTQVSLVLLAGF